MAVMKKPLALQVLICHVGKQIIISKVSKSINNIILTLKTIIKLKQMLLLIILCVLKLICHVTDEIYEIKINWKVEFGNID